MLLQEGGSTAAWAGPKGRGEQRGLCDHSPLLLARVCECVGGLQINHTRACISGQWGRSRHLSSSSFIPFSRMPTFSIKGMCSFIIRKTSGNVTLTKGSQPLGNFLIHISHHLHWEWDDLSYTRDCWAEQETPQHLHRNLVWSLESTPIPGGRQEMRSGYFAVSLVNKLWDHILFPFLSLLHRVTDSAAQGPFPRPAPLNWLILRANSQREMKARTSVSWGMDSKGSRKIKNARQTPVVTHRRLFLTLFSEHPVVGLPLRGNHLEENLREVLKRSLWFLKKGSRDHLEPRRVKLVTPLPSDKAAR